MFLGLGVRTVGHRDFAVLSVHGRRGVGRLKSRARGKMPVRPQLVAYCCLLLPRGFRKSCEVSEKAGRGGGDRTHDLRLKRPLLYH